MSDYYAQIERQVTALIGHYRDDAALQKLRQRVTALGTDPGGEAYATQALTDWSSVLTRFLASLSAILGQTGGTAAQRQDAVVRATLAFYAATLKPILREVIGRPIIFDWVIGPAIERFLPAVALGLYNGLGAILTRLGGGPTAPPTPPTPGPSVPSPVNPPALPPGWQPY